MSFQAVLHRVGPIMLIKLRTVNTIIGYFYRPIREENTGNF
jgi:hypothetical protein